MAERIDIDAMQAQTSRASALLTAMCNEKRLLLLCHLVDGERSVNELASLLSMPQSSVSQHLRVLRHEGLVRARRDAQRQNYSLAGDEARAILETLQTLYCEPQPVDA